MYTQHNPSFASFLHQPYELEDTQVKYVDDNGIEHSARKYQQEAVLAMHGDRSRILSFQKKVEEFQEEMFSIGISLPLKKAFVIGEIKFSLSVQDRQEKSETEYTDDYEMYFFTKSFYTMTREDNSTATFIVVEKFVK